jgi:putative endonuclease
MACTYIIYSPSSDSYYVGSCLNFEERLEKHNSHYFSNAFTSKASDWITFVRIENLTQPEARFLEAFIKKMRNRDFYLKLRNNPEIALQIIREKMK